MNKALSHKNFKISIEMRLTVFGLLLSVFLPILFPVDRVYTEQLYLLFISSYAAFCFMYGRGLLLKAVPVYIQYLFFSQVIITTIPLVYSFLYPSIVNLSFYYLLRGVFQNISLILIIICISMFIPKSCNLQSKRLNIIIFKYIRIMNALLIINGIFILAQKYNIYKISNLLHYFYLGALDGTHSTAYYASRLGRYTGVFSVPVVSGSIYALGVLAEAYMCFKYKIFTSFFIILLLIFLATFSGSKVVFFLLVPLLMLYSIHNVGFRCSTFLLIVACLLLLGLCSVNNHYFESTHRSNLFIQIFRTRVSQGSYVQYYINKYVSHSFASGIGFLTVPSVDSGYLWIILQSGVVGLVLYLAKLLYPLYYFLGKKKTMEGLFSIVIIIFTALVNLGHPILFAHHYLYLYLPLLYLMLLSHDLQRKKVK
jgi:hypothetical protein